MIQCQYSMNFKNILENESMDKNYVCGHEIKDFRIWSPFCANMYYVCITISIELSKIVNILTMSLEYQYVPKTATPLLD